MATTCGVIRWKCARLRFEVCWPKLALALRSNEHIEGDGPTIFAHACQMGLGHVALEVVTNTGGRVGWHNSPLPGPFFPQ